MKRKQKIALLSVAAIPAMITMVPDTDVQAATGQPFSGTIVNPDHEFDGKSQAKRSLAAPASATSINAENEAEFKDALKAQFENYSTNFVVTYNGPTIDLEKVIKNYIPTFGGELDTDNEYIAQTIVSVDYLSSGYKNNIVTFTVKYHTDKTKETAVDAKIQQIIKDQLPNIDTMSEFEKVKTIHDYVVQNASYATNTTASPHSAYALLHEGKGVSQAYALVTHRLLKEAKLNAHFVSGTTAGGTHAWNIVEVDGKWYHLDTTWDDSTFSNMSDATNDFVRYKYFLMPDNMMTSTHKFTSTDYPFNKGLTDDKFKEMAAIQQPFKDGSTLYFGSTIAPYELSKLDLAKNPLKVEPVVAGATHTTKKRIVLNEGWLFFSDDANGGYLTKVQTNGKNLTVLDKTNASDLKISGTNLEYKKADNTTGKIPLAATSSGPTVGEVSKLIGNIGTDPYAATLNEPNKPLDAHDPYDHSYIDAVIVAKVAYDQLTKEQQDNVTDPNPLTKAITNIETGTNKIYEVMWKIALLDETAKSFKVDVIAARQLFADLPSDAHRQAVKNIKDLDAAWDKVNDFADVVDVVRDKINKINPNFTNYYEKIKEARAAYDALSLAQRELLKTELTDLEDKERLMAEDETAVFDINYRLNLLDDTAADFKESFTAIDDLIKNLKDSPGTAVANKKTLINTMDFYNTSQGTFTAYDKKAKTLETRLADTLKVVPPVLADVQKLYADFKALNDAQKAFLAPTFEAELKQALADANAVLNTADYVDKKIEALSVADSGFKAKVKDARDAHDALPSSIINDVKKLDTLVEAEKIVIKIDTINDNLKTLPTEAKDFTTTVAYVDKVQELEKQLILLGKNLELNADPEDPKATVDPLLDMEGHIDKHIDERIVTDARKNLTDGKLVNDQLDELDVTSSLADITAARTAYDALTDISKKFVTDSALDKLKEQETRTNKAAADEVTALIDALVQTDPYFLDKLKGARDRYTDLSEEQKKFVTLETLKKLEGLEKASENLTKVYNAIEAISEVDVKNYIANYDAAWVLYTKLGEDQKPLISNRKKLDKAKANIDAAKAVIAEVDTLSKDSTEEAILAVKAKYDALEDFQKKLVTNYSKLESLIDKANGKEEAEAVIKMIDKLDETKKTFAVDVKRARDAYDKLSPKQKEYVTNYEDLLAAEKKVADLAGTSDIAQKLIAQIAAINNTSASFKTDVDAAKSAYAALSEEQQALINNYNVLKEHLATYDTYAAQAKKLEDKINALSNTSPGYQSALAALQSEYNAFNAAQKAFVAEYAVKLLDAAQSGIDAVRNVTNMILALNQYKITFHADVANARAAYNALIKNHGVYLAAYLEEALEKAEALVEKDKTAARKVVNAINSLSSDSILKEIERARRVYNNLTALQRPLVTNLQTLIDFETGKLSYNTSGIPDGVDTDDTNTDTEEINPLPDFAAVPGERTAMTKSSKGDTYTAKIFVSNEVGNSERFVLTTRANVTAIIPPTVTVVGDKTGTMAIEIQATSSRVSFKATMDKKAVTFATEVDIILESVPKNSVILRVDQYGNRVPATYTVDGDQYTIKTKGSDTFIITRSTTTFTDIQNDSHREYIEELAARNIIQNDGNGRFNPNQNITRAEFAVMMARALDIQPSTDTNFNDIRGKSYENEVQALYEVGIIQGVNSTTFNPNSTLTRQQAAMMVERMLDYANVDTNVWESPQFTDAHLIAGSAINAVALMQSLDIVSGKPNGSFDPLGKLTRSQLAKILYKALQSAEML